jgi:SET domain-containing protein
MDFSSWSSFFRDNSKQDAIKSEGKSKKKENEELWEIGPDGEVVNLPNPYRELVIIRQSSLHGLGLFAARDIPEGTHIIQYVGPIVDKKDKQLMTSAAKRYLYKLDEDFSIDGSPLYNIARYINHRCSANNCTSISIRKPSQDGKEKSREVQRDVAPMEGEKERGSEEVINRPQKEVWIVAKTFIPKGTELTYSYGRSYWRNSKKRVCRCGSPCCFGLKPESGTGAF